MVFFKSKSAAAAPKSPSPVTVTANGESVGGGAGASPSSTSTSASSDNNRSRIGNSNASSSSPSVTVASKGGEALVAKEEGGVQSQQEQRHENEEISDVAVNIPQSSSPSSSSSSPDDSKQASGGKRSVKKRGIIGDQGAAIAGNGGGVFSSASTTKQMNTTRRRKRGRVVRMACVQDDNDLDASSCQQQTRMVKTKAAAAHASKSSPLSVPAPIPSSSSSSTQHHHHILPEFQYETTLTRRAIRKCSSSTAAGSDGSSVSSSSASTTNDDPALLLSLRDAATGLEMYGDVSLGMKLGIVAGHVIVQSVNALADGRASPAQLSGVIHRGDVLLEINGKSLLVGNGVTLWGDGVDSLMGRLKPLSEPTVVMDQSSNSSKSTTTTSLTAATAAGQPSFARHVRLRFSSGQGLEILRKSSEQAARHGRTYSGTTSSSPPTSSSSLVMAASDVFSLFPMVDQLSGMPLMFDDPTPTSMPSLPNDQHLHRNHDGRSSNTVENKKSPEKREDQRSSSSSSSRTEHRPNAGPRHHRNNNNNNKQQQGRFSNFLNDDDISHILAEQRANDRNAYSSEFFDWNDDFSTLLRRENSVKRSRSCPCTTEEEKEEESKLQDETGINNNNNTDSLTHQELMELGRRAARGAKLLSAIMEKVDRGSDRRSIYSLSATLSLFSRASTRRRYVLDSQAMPINIEKVDEDSKEALDDINEDGDVDDMGSSRNGSGDEDDEELDGDELLLRLAARDEIWKTQVIEFLEKVIQEAKDASENMDSLPETQEVTAATTEDMDAAMTNELGIFLFGESMAKVLKQHRKPQALPPEEITALLFDLTTKVSSTVPDQIKTATGGSHMSHLSCMVPFTGMKRQPAESNGMLATRYLLHDVLPVWLKTFRPLPWDQRRVLWPLDKAAWSTESTAESTMSDDSLTADDHSNMRSPLSMSMTAATSGTRSPTRKKKNLREQIEDQELNVETRSETCFLATFYFTQQLLPRLSRNENEDKDKEDFCDENTRDESPGGINMGTVNIPMQEAVEFVQHYGAYLKMQTCLSYAAVLEAQPVIDVLLNVAKYDPRHREVSKQFGKASALVFYDPTMLSAIVQRLQEIRSETNADRRITTVELCSAAYPDVRPWQVKKQCYSTPSGNAKGTEPLEDLYYIYLSMLLHPTDGHDVARHDPALVKEWCELSVAPDTEVSTGSRGGKMTMAAEGQRRKNFMSVASRASSDHLSYSRDFELLLDLSMQVNELELSLDLATELLEDPAALNKSNVIVSVVSHLRQIGCAALDMAAKDEQFGDMGILKRIIRLYNKASTSSSTPLAAQNVIDVPHELLQLLEHPHQAANDGSSNVEAPINKMSLIRFLSQQAVPTDLLEALSRWFAQNLDSHLDLYPILQTILHRGLQGSPDNELSGSLLRLRQARARLRKLQPSSVDSQIIASMKAENVCLSDCRRDLWKNMSKGKLTIAK